MDQMWSPWRSQHISSFSASKSDAKGSRSVFSRLAEENRDEENLILWRGEYLFVVMNLFPYNNGHIMIVPFRQVADYTELDAAEQSEMFSTLEKCLRWLRYALKPEGFNVGMNLGKAAGAGIPDHLHLHVVPRWSGDTNFMPAIGEIKVIPEAIRDTYNKIKRAIQEVS